MKMYINNYKKRFCILHFTLCLLKNFVSYHSFYVTNFVRLFGLSMDYLRVYYSKNYKQKENFLFIVNNS